MQSSGGQGESDGENEDEVAEIAGEIAAADRDRLVARFGRTFAAGEALFREGDRKSVV